MNILLVSPMFPQLSEYGGRQRTNLIYRSLKELGKVDILIATDLGVFSRQFTDSNEVMIDTSCDDGEMLGIAGWNEPELNDGDLTVQYKPIKNVANWVKQKLRGRRYDLLVSRLLYPLCRIDGFELADKSILDYDDADHLNWNAFIDNNQVGNEDRSANHELNKNMLAIIEDRVKRFDTVWFTSTKDQNRTDFATGEVLPNIPFIKNKPVFNTNNSERNPSIMMVGFFKYPTNREGADHFITRLWNKIRALVPNAELYLVGQTSEADVVRWSAIDGVKPIGFVNDLASYYRQVDFTVAPIYFGGGTNIKVVESYAYGKPCVVTPCSYYGYEELIPEGEAILLAQNDEQMIDHCVRLLTSNKDCLAMGKNGYLKIQSVSSFEYFSGLVADSVNKLITKV